MIDVRMIADRQTNPVLSQHRIYVLDTQIHIGGLVTCPAFRRARCRGSTFMPWAAVVHLDSERLAGHEASLKPTWVRGGDGNDVIVGGKGPDYLSGYAGDDFLIGNDGGDALLDQDGRDYLDGGWGDDELFGGLGDDWLWGGDGFDRVDGGDRVNGRAGRDFAWGGAQADYFRDLGERMSGPFYSPLTAQYAQYSGIQDYRSFDGDRIL